MRQVSLQVHHYLPEEYNEGLSTDALQFGSYIHKIFEDGVDAESVDELMEHATRPITAKFMVVRPILSNASITSTSSTGHSPRASLRDEFKVEVIPILRSTGSLTAL